MWGGSIRIRARPFWGRGVFVFVISNINIGFQKLLTLPLRDNIKIHSISATLPLSVTGCDYGQCTHDPSHKNKVKNNIYGNCNGNGLPVCAFRSEFTLRMWPVPSCYAVLVRLVGPEDWRPACPAKVSGVPRACASACAGEYSTPSLGSPKAPLQPGRCQNLAAHMSQEAPVSTQRQWMWFSLSWPRW